jgi:dTMP kinase
MSRGFFFSIEGVDGAGKTTQVQQVAEKLREVGYSVCTHREPGGTEVGEGVRKLLLESAHLPDKTELLLFLAARSALVPILLQEKAAGNIVLLDRFVDSTIAYQGFGRGLDVDDIENLNMFATDGEFPDHTWMLMVPPTISASRRAGRGDALDRIESAGFEFNERVRNGYVEQAREYSDRITVVDATENVEDVTKTLLHAMVKFMLSAAT